MFNTTLWVTEGYISSNESLAWNTYFILFISSYFTQVNLISSFIFSLCRTIREITLFFYSVFLVLIECGSHGRFSGNMWWLTENLVNIKMHNISPQSLTNHITWLSHQGLLHEMVGNLRNKFHWKRPHLMAMDINSYKDDRFVTLWNTEPLFITAYN